MSMFLYRRDNERGSTMLIARASRFVRWLIIQPRKFLCHRHSPELAIIANLIRPLILIAIPIAGANAQFDLCQDREWVDFTGKHKTVGKLIAIEEDRVALATKSSNNVKVKLRDLSENDSSYVKAFLSIQDTLKSRDESIRILTDLESDLAKLESTSRNSGPQAIASHKVLIAEAVDKLTGMHDSDSNLFSGFLGATFLSLGKDPVAGKIGRAAPVQLDPGSFRRASRYLESAIERLRNCEKHFPGQYTPALCSALNNFAVLSLKLSQPSRAASLLGEVCLQSEVSHIASLHNAKLLLKLGAEKKSIFALKSSQIKMLKDATANASEEEHGLPLLFLYSLDFDGSTSANKPPSGQGMNALSQLRIRPEHSCFVCSGKGIVSCRSCANGVVNTSVLKQIGVDPRTGRPITVSVPAATACGPCRGKGFFKCTFCDGGQI